MKTLNPLALAVVIAASALVALPTHAAGDPVAKTVLAQAATPAGDMVDGEVRKVDTEAAKLTLKHGEIKNLDMPAMTMVFNVKDKALLDKLKAGDKVKFKAVNDAGKFTVTEIRVAP